MTLKHYLQKQSLEHTSNLLADLQTAATRKLTSRQTLQTLAETVSALPEYITTAAPTRVNATLHQFIQAIHITKTHTLTIEYK